MKAKHPVTEDAMRLRMAGLCARTEQCSSDLRQKILRAGLSASQAEDILRFLREQKFLDEERFAIAFSRDKVRFSGWGRLKIRQALLAKRITSSDIEEGLKAIEPKEYIDALKKAAIAKARSLNLCDMADKAKLYRHLATRGFETSMISKIVEYLASRSRE